MNNTQNSVAILGGCGQMGQVIVDDLIEFGSFDKIFLLDINYDLALSITQKYNCPKLIAKKCDLTNANELVDSLKDVDILINSTPYIFNVEIMKACLKSHTHYLDLGGLFYKTLEQLKLSADFVKSGLIAILGMGAAPGITNLMVKYLSNFFDKVDDVEISDGAMLLGEYNQALIVPYSIDTIIDEYCKPAKIFQNGQLLDIDGLASERTYDFGKRIGEIRGIYTLHSELATLPDFLKNKDVKNLSFSLAFPSVVHDKFKFLIQLAKKRKLNLNNNEIDMVSLLKELVAHQEVDDKLIKDYEVIQVSMTGSKNNKLQKYRIRLYADCTDKFGAGAINTGVPPSIVAQYLNLGAIKSSGAMPPENIIDEIDFFNELGRRNLKIKVSSKFELN